MSDASRQRFSSRWGLLLSVLGIAVGTGNIWRFPRIAAQNGGEQGAGAFLLAWVVFLLLWSVPLIIAEYAVGCRGRKGVVGSFIVVAGERFAWMGAFVGFVATAIMFYYSVVFHGVAMGVGAVAVYRGVSSIERVNKVLVPMLLVIVLISLLRAVTLDGSSTGLAYLFTPQWDQLSRPNLWLEALTQNAWDTGAGWGLIITYGAYMRRSHGVVKNAFITGFANNTVSLLAAITIFGTVFAILGAEMSRPEVLAVMRDSGPASTGLTFIWMPQLFAKMPMGTTVAVLFFLGLTFAAISSLISMIELATRTLVDMGISRSRAVLAVAGAGLLLGVPSAMSLDFLSNQDFVWGVALMISGAFVAFAVISHGIERFRADVVDATPGDWKGGRTWGLLIGRAVPVQAAVLLVWWLYLSTTTYAPDTWYDPLDPFSVATCLVQWLAVAGVLLWLNRWLVRRTS
jgi:NSS family neurotransmitter:Na+ symporter